MLNRGTSSVITFPIRSKTPTATSDSYKGERTYFKTFETCTLSNKIGLWKHLSHTEATKSLIGFMKMYRKGSLKYSAVLCGLYFCTVEGKYWWRHLIWHRRHVVNVGKSSPSYKGCLACKNPAEEHRVTEVSCCHDSSLTVPAPVMGLSDTGRRWEQRFKFKNRTSEQRYLAGLYLDPGHYHALLLIVL